MSAGTDQVNHYFSSFKYTSIKLFILKCNSSSEKKKNSLSHIDYVMTDAVKKKNKEQMTQKTH